MAINKEMSFLEHLEELRWHLVRIIIAIIIGGILAASYVNEIVDKILLSVIQNDFISYRIFNKLFSYLGFEPIFVFNEMQKKIQNDNPTGQISVFFIVIIVSGIIISFPYIIYEIWRFIRPALHENERKNAGKFIFCSIFLFLLGVGFGYFLISPLSMQFLYGFSLSDSISNEFQIENVISVIVNTCLGMGLAFLMPILVYFLTKLGIITPHLLTNNRKYAFVIIMIITAFISVDFTSNFIIIIPLWLLFEVSIWVSKSVYYAQNKSESAVQKIS